MVSLFIQNLIKEGDNMDIHTWEEDIYNSIFEATFDALIAQYKEGSLPLTELEKNIEEQFVILQNSSTEGSVRFNQCSATIDAHQYALAFIKKEL